MENDMALPAHTYAYACRQDNGMNDLILESTLTCPNCGHQKTETMPTAACQYYYECEACHQLLKPRPGDCCVFCFFGSVKCPPIQEGGGCCG
jgi:hypothetical protein